MPTPSKPQTFENSTHLRIFLILCKVFGTRPVITVQDFRLGQRLLISFAHILWSCFILGLIVFSMNELNVQYMIGIAPILRILNLSEYTLNLMNCFIIMVGSNYQRQWQDIYFRHLKSIDERLQFSMAEANAKLNQFLHVVFMVSLAFIVPVMTIMFNFYVGNLRALAITYIAYIVTNLIIALGLIQFFVLLFMVEMRYKHLVSALGGLSWSETFSHFPANAGIYRNTFVLEMRAIGRKNNSHLNQHLSSIKRRIDVLRTCYVDLNILERNISESFGFFIVSLVISTFFVETSKLYVFYTLTRENVDFLTLAYSAFWLILHLVILFSLLYFSSRVGQQKSNVAWTLHQMRFGGKDKEAEIMTAISQFSLQIMHEDRHQMACGIFQLDLTLLSSIVSSLTTYLVILIQFDSTSQKNVGIPCSTPTPSGQ